MICMPPDHSYDRGDGSMQGACCSPGGMVRMAGSGTATWTAASSRVLCPPSSSAASALCHVGHTTQLQRAWICRAGTGRPRSST